MANNIRALRRAALLSQKELSALLGVTQGAVSHWEQGRNNPTYPMLCAIAVALKCTVDALTDHKEDTAQ